MLDLFSTDQQNLQSPLNGQVTRAPEPSTGEAFSEAGVDAVLIYSKGKTPDEIVALQDDKRTRELTRAHLR